MRGLVFDIETRLDSAAIRAVAPARRIRGMPAPLRTVIAAAMLEFEMDQDGICTGFALHGIDRRTAGEKALVVAIERRLDTLERREGRLVTYNGQHDLNIIRLAALRHRQFSPAAAAAWQRDLRDAHDDVMLMVTGNGADWFPRLADLCVSLGCVSHREVMVVDGPVRPERMKAELDVIQTMLVYLHLLSERHLSAQPLVRGVSGLAHMLEAKTPPAPHINSVLRAEIFKSLAPRCY